VIERAGKQRLYLVIMPLANDQVTPEIEAKRNTVVKDIVDRIGLAPDHLLDTPVSVPLRNTSRPISWRGNEASQKRHGGHALTNAGRSGRL
jgi:hypothetical protein